MVQNFHDRVESSIRDIKVKLNLMSSFCNNLMGHHDSLTKLVDMAVQELNKCIKSQPEALANS